MTTHTRKYSLHGKKQQQQQQMTEKENRTEKYELREEKIIFFIRKTSVIFQQKTNKMYPSRF